MNWVVPGKILALSSPTAKKNDGLPPEAFMENFEKMNIKGIIRLNEPLYDQRIFNQAGIAVHDLEFLDGSCPDDVFDCFILSYLLSIERDKKLY